MSAEIIFNAMKSPNGSNYLAHSVAFVVDFVAKQISACLFGVLMILGIVFAFYFYPDSVPLAKYDFLVLYALSIQIGLIILKLETWNEAKVILIFHIIGTIMEIYKTHYGSWQYPEENVLRLGGVPLFTGFMYASVGSYLARSLRLFDIKFTYYPPFWLTLILGVLVYINFFLTNHQIDFRWPLFIFSGLIYFRCMMQLKIWRIQIKIPLLLAFVFVAFLIYLAENIGTATRTWLYPNQTDGWEWVQIAKMGSWYLLMILSFVLVTIVHFNLGKKRKS